MPKTSKGYGSDPRSLNVTAGHGADRKHDFHDHEYEKAHAEANKASGEFRKAQEAYRSRKIGDSEYLAARKKHDEASKVFDAAYAKAAGWTKD